MMNQRYYVKHDPHVYDFVVDSKFQIISVKLYLHMSSQTEDLTIDQVPDEVIHKLQHKILQNVNKQQDFDS